MFGNINNIHVEWQILPERSRDQGKGDKVAWSRNRVKMANTSQMTNTRHNNKAVEDDTDYIKIGKTPN